MFIFKFKLSLIVITLLRLLRSAACASSSLSSLTLSDVFIISVVCVDKLSVTAELRFKQFSVFVFVLIDCSLDVVWLVFVLFVGLTLAFDARFEEFADSAPFLLLALLLLLLLLVPEIVFVAVLCG